VPPIIAAPPEPPAVTPPPTPTSRLAEEVALLDTARDALSAGDLRAASAALATHLVEFQQGVLVPESEILRIEVHLGLGQGPAAVALATRFLERFPDNALAKRARTLLERATRM
jgi:outer membrane protein assembly factor BamD (BamD/ComL family)